MTLKSWTLEVDEEGVVQFPQELLEAYGLTPDTVLEWSINDDSSISFKKANQDDLNKASSESAS